MVIPIALVGRVCAKLRHAAQEAPWGKKAASKAEACQKTCKTNCAEKIYQAKET